jgi:hypothetical protein
VSPQTRILIGGGAAAALCALLFLAWRQMPWWAFIGVSAAGAVPVLWGLWPLLAELEWIQPLVPLPQVARLLHRATRRSEIADFAESIQEPSEVLNWYALWAFKRGLPIYGKKNGTDVLALVPATLVGSVKFDNAAQIIHGTMVSQPLYTDLAVRRRDLRTHWHLVTRV